MHGDEYMMDGGITTCDGTRTDIYLKEVGPGKGEAAGVPFSLSLVLVSGNVIVDLVDCSPEAVERLGRWLTETARETRRARTGE